VKEDLFSIALESSRLVQDAVVRNLQTLTESSQRLTEAVAGGRLGAHGGPMNRYVLKSRVT
jgi:hypothetical protein